MKRSEMIDLIYNDIVTADDLMDVGYVIDKLIKLGMRQPEYTQRYTRTYRKNGKVIGTSERQMQIVGWEPEDGKT